MKKLLFNIITFILSFILYYLFWVFIYLDYPPMDEWDMVWRGFWLVFGGVMSALGANTAGILLWDWYYHLDD